LACRPARTRSWSSPPETAGTAQIGSYVVLKDNATNDTSFFFME
jgi:hypothetical protein